MTGSFGGARIGITRSPEGAERMSRLVRDLGGVPVVLPTSRIEEIPSEATGPAPQIETYDGVLFTSAVAVHFASLRLDSTAWLGRRIVAIGAATRTALEALGIEGVLTPPEGRAEGLLSFLDELYGDTLAGTRWLLPRAQEAREVLPQGLRARGAVLDVWPLYRSGPANDPSEILAQLRTGVDVLSFASGSAVRHLRLLLGSEFQALLSGVPVAVLGPVTSEECRAHGLRVEVEAPEPRIEALVDAMATWWVQR